MAACSAMGLSMHGCPGADATAATRDEVKRDRRTMNEAMIVFVVLVAVAAVVVLGCFMFYVLILIALGYYLLLLPSTNKVFLQSVV